MRKKELQELEKIAEWMDDKFAIPGTTIRFGLDAIFGLIPGLGDTGTLFVTLYLSDKARQYGLPRHIHMRMFWNAFIDWLIGIIPLVGDIFDLGWKANRRNVALLHKHLKK